ncbi:hypothetical protein [Insolitispirillum peregrinum]|uniref:hypothetical protein n=1 Tax=Insolitispirillum peregrinum TaxID=80876 RepID=UPI003616658A
MPRLLPENMTCLIDPPDRFGPVEALRAFLVSLDQGNLSEEERAYYRAQAQEDLDWRLSHPLPGDDGYSPDLYDDEGELITPAPRATPQPKR